MKLRLKLVIFISWVIFVILASAAGLIIIFRSSEIERDLIIRDKITSEKMVPDLVNAMANYYTFQFDTYAQMVKSALWEDPDIVYMRIFKTDGEVSFDSTEILKGKYNNSSVRSTKDKYILETIYGQKLAQDFIFYNNQKVIRVLTPYTDSYGVYRAMVEFYFSTSQISNSITQMVIYFSTLFGIFWILGVLATLVVANQIVKPISKLTAGAKELTKGNLDIVVDVNTRDEIGELAIVFNQMAAKLKGHYEELEEKVRERTRDLEKAKTELEETKKKLETTNLDLDTKVKARTEELEGLKNNLEQIVNERTDLLKKSMEESEKTLSLLSATLDATDNGILVVDKKGLIERYNKKFIELWKIPQELAEQKNDSKLLNFVTSELENPTDFMAKVTELYAHPQQSSDDLIKFKDGRIFERNSQPQLLGDTIVGRVWSFKDVTPIYKNSEELRQRAGELEKINSTMVNRELKMIELKKRVIELESQLKIG